MVDKQSNDGLRELALFAGAGGGILGGKLLGWRTVCAVERDAYAAAVLAQRQNDGCLEPFPVWSDVGTFDGKPWRGIVDVVSGGFPCQDISVAGKGAGIDGERSGLWSEFARIIREVQPRYVFVENSPALTSRGLGTVLGDLAEMGFNAGWECVSASSQGAPHKRDRIWIVANSVRNGCAPSNWGRYFCHKNRKCEGAKCGRVERQPVVRGDCENVANATKLLGNGGNDNAGCGVERRQVPESRDSCGAENVANQNSPQRQGNESSIGGVEKRAEPNQHGCRFPQWPSESGLDRVVDGMAHRVDRLKAIGNGQVPRVAAAAFRIIGE